MGDQAKVSIGDELKDGYKVTDNWLGNGAKWLDDIQNFYRERSAIEKEYASKLQQLTGKYFEKKAKQSTSLSVGDTPQVTPGSLENASLVTWTEILNQTEQEAKEKQRLGEELALQVADQVHGIELRVEDLRKRYGSYNEKMIEDRDKYYNELKKTKSTYDQVCQSMENQRMKASKSAGDKASRKMQEKEAEMNNQKNTYLIKINVANRLKEKYYHEDVPEMLDGMQQLNEARVAILNSFWAQAVELERACYNRCHKNLDAMNKIVDQNKPGLDSAMFVKHNIAQWTEPADFQYEPSPIWHDDDQMITNDMALQFLRNKLTESQGRLSSQKSATEDKFEKYNKVLEKKKNSSSLKPSAYMQLLSEQVNSMQDLTTFDTLRLTYQVEVETIEVAANGKDLAALPPMEVKKRGLFGRKKTVKVGADGNQLARSETNASVGSKESQANSALGAGQNAGSFLSSIMHRSKSKKGQQTSLATQAMVDGKQLVKAQYTYTALADDELTVLPAQELILLEPDDGSGWAQVKNEQGSSGLVPASYVETVAASSSSSTEQASSSGTKKKQGPAVAPKKGAKKVKYMIALYNYDSTGSDELTIREGDKIQVVNDDDGSGWTEGELNGMSGVFPTAFAKLA